MNDHDLMLLRSRILRYFLQDGARQTSELLDQPDMQSYNPAWLRKLVYSLERAGLLDKFGTTSGAFYMTSHLGYIVLVTLNEELRCKARERPYSGLK